MPSRIPFHQALDGLWAGMVELARLDVVAMERATLAMSDANRQLAELVIASAAEVDERQQELEAQVVDVIALQQPVASDLRLVLSAVPMSASLARMGGLAKHVAQTTRMRAPDPVAPAELRDVFEQMGRAAVGTASALHDALEARSAAQAAEVATSDDAMDALHRRMFLIVLDPDWPHSTEVAIDATLLGRFYERFADQAVNIARRLHYIVEGTYPAARSTLSI